MLRKETEKLFPYNSQEKLASSYLHFDLDLTDWQKEALNNLKIEKTSAEYQNYGEFTNILEEIDEFLRSLGNDSTVSFPITHVIIELIKRILLTMEQESAWVVIRASQPNSLYKIPRWHTDGYYFSPFKGEQYKVVATLLGPSTLFHNLPPENRESFNALGNVRQKTAVALKDVVPESASSGQGTVFIAGSKESAAVHSEPNISVPRLFIAIAPGSESQVKDRPKLQLAFEKSPEYQEALNAQIKMNAIRK